MNSIVLKLPEKVSLDEFAEIKKQLFFVSESILSISLTEDYKNIEVMFVSAPQRAVLEALEKEIKSLMQAFELSKNKAIFKKNFFKSQSIEPIQPLQLEQLNLAKPLGSGIYAYAGILQKLLNGLDSHFQKIAINMGAKELIFPNLIKTETLLKTGYLKNFPHQSQIVYDPHSGIDNLRNLREHLNHNRALEKTENLDSFFKPSDFCLTPAVCYHCYEFHQNSQLENRKPLIVTAVQSCYRFEGKSTGGLERLREFKMREIIAMGSVREIHDVQKIFIDVLSNLCDEFELNCHLKPANDPFFIDDYNAKRIFQTGFDLKLELLAQFQSAPSIAVSSINYHQNYFGNAFKIKLEDDGFAHSCCIGFGLDRWIATIISAHGTDPKSWPKKLRTLV